MSKKLFLVLQKRTPAALGLTYRLRLFVKASALGSTLEAGLVVEHLASGAEMMLDAVRAHLGEAAPLRESVRSTCCCFSPTVALYAAACPTSGLIASSRMRKAAGIQLQQDPA